MKAVVTGATGFVGRHLVSHLRGAGWQVVAVARSPQEGHCAVGDLATASSATLERCLEGADVVFHLAGRAHRTDRGRDPSLAQRYRRDNVQAAQRVYAAACAAGIGRFVFLSTIKVLGDTAENPLKTTAVYAPPDIYSVSKCEAETALQEACAGGAPLTIVRPPLVYGPGVGGNFARLLRLVKRGWPIPLGAATAPRSLIYVANLCDLLARLSDDHEAFRVVHARDVDLGVSALVQGMTSALNARTRCVAIPGWIVRLFLSIVRQTGAYQSLFEPLLVDDSETRRDFQWTPPIGFQDALAATVGAGSQGAA